MQIFTESSSDLWKKFSAPEFSFQKTFIYPTAKRFYFHWAVERTAMMLLKSIYLL